MYVCQTFLSGHADTLPGAGWSADRPYHSEHDNGRPVWFPWVSWACRCYGSACQRHGMSTCSLDMPELGNQFSRVNNSLEEGERKILSCCGWSGTASQFRPRAEANREELRRDIQRGAKQLKQQSAALCTSIFNAFSAGLTRVTEVNTDA